MSARKHKSLARRLEILRMAERGKEYGVVFHREGGLAMSNPDVRRLIKDGHLKFVRFSSRRGKPLSPKRFRANFRRDYGQIDEYAFERDRRLPQMPGCKPQFQRPPSDGFLGGHVHGSVNITRGVITESGMAYLARNNAREA